MWLSKFLDIEEEVDNLPPELKINIKKLLKVKDRF